VIAQVRQIKRQKSGNSNSAMKSTARRPVRQHSTVSANRAATSAYHFIRPVPRADQASNAEIAVICCLKRAPINHSRRSTVCEVHNQLLAWLLGAAEVRRRAAHRPKIVRQAARGPTPRVIAQVAEVPCASGAGTAQQTESCEADPERAALLVGAAEDVQGPRMHACTLRGTECVKSGLVRWQSRGDVR
jgi:hypothetical protein